MKVKETNFLNNYKVLGTLGKGSYGEVVRVINKYTGIEYAAKKISKEQIPTTKKQRLFMEMAILNQLDHPNVIKIIEVYDHMQRYVLIL